MLRAITRTGRHISCSFVTHSSKIQRHGLPTVTLPLERSLSASATEVAEFTGKAEEEIDHSITFLERDVAPPTPTQSSATQEAAADSRSTIQEQAGHELTNKQRDEAGRLLARDTKEIEQIHQSIELALFKQDPHGVLEAFCLAANGPGYLQILPAQTLLHVLHQVRPEVILDPFKEIYKDIHPSVVMSDKTMKPLATIMQAYYKVVQLVLSRSVELARGLKLAEYRILLNICRHSGFSKEARSLFKQLRADRVEPDLDCYHSIMEAVCLEKAHDQHTGRLYRATPSSLRIRGLNSPRNPTHPNENLKDEVMSYMDQLMTQGFSPTATTYALLLKALGIVGDLDGVKEILSRVWGVDIEKIMSDDDDADLFEDDSTKQNLTPPDDFVLRTVAETYGSNNKVPVALRAVDHISRRYGVEISMHTWMVLLDWTFVLSLPRGGRNKQRVQDKKTGQLPLSAVTRVYDTMTSPTYNVQATMPALDHTAVAAWRSVQHGGDTDMAPLLRIIELGAGIHQQSTQSRVDLEKHTVRKVKQRPPYEVARARELRDRLRVSRWLRFLLSRSARTDLNYCFCTIPNILKRYESFRPRDGVSYDTPSGRVVFHPNETWDRMRSAAFASKDLTLEQSIQAAPRGIYSGPTRQTRLQNRHKFQHFRNLTEGPKLQPRWHEAKTVKDWAGTASD